MREIKLTKQEKAIEDALLGGEYASAGKKQLQEISLAIEARKKDAVLNIRINSGDLKSLKQKAQKLGVKYQTFISEVLHRIAQA
ncbi:MAG: CopG family antitoxin [Candidatus Omnitrophota bacterium]|nr:CopG family antitoxin [Candidatus Omnitrophota bacterium]MDZ4241268.1 CopG family antitoxin [Candidatus Omnitrophota bacterium]